LFPILVKERPVGNDVRRSENKTKGLPGKGQVMLRLDLISVCKGVEGLGLSLTMGMELSQVKIPVPAVLDINLPQKWDFLEAEGTHGLKLRE